MWWRIWSVWILSKLFLLFLFSVCVTHLNINFLLESLLDVLNLTLWWDKCGVYFSVNSPATTFIIVTNLKVYFRVKKVNKKFITLCLLFTIGKWCYNTHYLLLLVTQRAVIYSDHYLDIVVFPLYSSHNKVCYHDSQ